MKESYVLKRRNGEACGYVMARDKEVRVRLPNEKGTAKMAVIYVIKRRRSKACLTGWSGHIRLPEAACWARMYVRAGGC